jgi:hypothetical protein
VEFQTRTQVTTGVSRISDHLCQPQLEIYMTFINYDTWSNVYLKIVVNIVITCVQYAINELRYLKPYTY